MASLLKCTEEEVYEKVKGIVHESKQNGSFAKSVREMIATLNNCCVQDLSLKHCWKWIKWITQEYVLIKKQKESSCDQTLQQAKLYLGVDDKSDFLPNLAQLILDAKALKAVAEASRQYFKFDGSYQQLEKLIRSTPPPF